MPDYDIAIIGAGISGSSLAAILAPSGLRTALLDRNVRGLPGSTGHAPGFVGLLNELPALTELARRSVAHYSRVPNGFANVGGLEIDGDAARADLAISAGLSAAVLSGEDARAKAPKLVKEARSGVWFAGDGVADARKIAHSFQDEAAASGVELLDVDVKAIRPAEGGYTLDLGYGGTMTARHVVICTNVWAPELAPSIPAIAVAHPYAYSLPHGETQTMPFVRWPSAHVYARDHGKRYGYGTYDHSPVHVTAKASAYGAWMGEFEQPLEVGRGFMPASTRALFDGMVGVDGEEEGEGALGEGQDQGLGPADAMTDKAYAFNGVFCVTPDGLPLAGRMEGEGAVGVWCILGSWVTHAAGNAEVLAGMIMEAEGREGGEEAVGEGRVSSVELRRALDPLRFEGQFEKAKEAALRSYNDIYNKDQK